MAGAHRPSWPRVSRSTRRDPGQCRGWHASTPTARGCSTRWAAQAQRVVETYDRRRESSEIADGARTAVAATAALGASALGLGALVAAVATTAAADVTGILAASVLAAMGLLVMPAKRRRARAEMREKVTALRARLGEALRSEFQAAQERGAQRLADGLAPYARFVRAEQERWDNVRATLTAWRGRAANLTTAVRRDRGATGDPEPTSGTT